MQIRYPKSFFKLLFVGFMLAVLPLLVGLLSNILAIERLAAQSQRAVYDAARIAHASRELNDTAASLERAAQQATVLRDATLWEGYRNFRARFRDAGSRLTEMPLETEIRKTLDDLLQQESALHEALTRNGTTVAEATATARRYAEISAATGILLDGSSTLIDREAESLRDLAAQTESQARTQLLVLLPLAIFVVAGFTYLLARPIKELNQGIRDLGERRLDTRIEVTGPEDLEQLGRQLDWLRLRLIQLEEQKSRFLRHVSHELKTPLTILREGSELLAEEVAGSLSERQREIVLILKQNSLELQRLIETLLRHGEAEFHLAPVKLQTVKPAQIIAAIVERQKLACAPRRIRVTQQIEDFVMQTDPERLRVVLDNLLSNAAKYSPDDGEIVVTARRQEGWAVLEVLDQGPGVAPAERERIFEPFYRGSADAAGAVRGSGLGLSIARDHVLAMGGNITVGEGQGRFTVTLPLGTP
ncbi:MAG: HAMP domain-containing histidine kinase [Sulfuritalea sp.]|jgi:two-component system sensor histidine kinase GlrK|nr:HAMP domain-containing histidine kinase [Sulfuritalea sp.]